MSWCLSPDDSSNDQNPICRATTTSPTVTTPSAFENISYTVEFIEVENSAVKSINGIKDYKVKIINLRPRSKYSVQVYAVRGAFNSWNSASVHAFTESTTVETGNTTVETDKTTVETDTTTVETDKTTVENNLALALGLGLGIPLAIILVGGIGFLTHRQLKRNGSRGSKPMATLAENSVHRGGAFVNLGMKYDEGASSSNLVSPLSTEGGISFSNLQAREKDKHNTQESRYIDENQEKLLRDEFAKVFKTQTRTSSSSSNISSQFKTLNRYTNIEPYDHTLVKVSNVSYINASYIMNKKFIATQDPWPNQDDDFWQMIWECNVRIIIRLSNDSAAHPTAHYIHDEIGGNWVMGHDELVVSVKDIQKNSCFQKRIITVTKDSNSRIIEHFHMTNWSEGSVPSCEDLYKLVTEARNAHNRYMVGSNGPQPVLVHCSAGIGRTGTVIALWCMMDEYEEKFFSNIVKTVQRLREDRMGMVQNEEQYIRVYECFEKFQENSTAIVNATDEYEQI